MLCKGKLAARVAEGEWGAHDGAQGGMGTTLPQPSVSPSQPQPRACAPQLPARSLDDNLSSAGSTGFAQSCGYIRNSIPLGSDVFGREQAWDPGAPRQGHGKQCNSLLTHRGSSFPIYF